MWNPPSGAEASEQPTGPSTWPRDPGPGPVRLRHACVGEGEEESLEGETRVWEGGEASVEAAVEAEEGF